MAKIEYDPAIKGISGTMGNFTYGANGGITFVKEKVDPTDPRTAAQMAVRGNLYTFAQAWANATQIQREAWDRFAASQSLGGRRRSGFNFFIACNSNRALVNLPVDVTAPTVDDGVAPPLAPLAAWATRTVGTDAAPNLTLPTQGVTPAGVSFAVYLTGTLSKGVMKTPVNKLKKVRVVAAGVALGTVNIGADYVAIFGGVPKVGQKFSVKVVTVSTRGFVRSGFLNFTAA